MREIGLEVQGDGISTSAGRHIARSGTASKMDGHMRKPGLLALEGLRERGGVRAEGLDFATGMVGGEGKPHKARIEWDEIEGFIHLFQC